jgi:predicted RNase H-like nuclease (RuvC/YqgF family)
MPDEIRIPINAKIPKSLHDSILAAVEAEQYKDKTACITEALEKLLSNTQEETQVNKEVLQEMENEIQNLQRVIQAKYTELQDYKNVLQDKESEIRRLQSVIQEAPDPLELAEMKGSYTGMQRLLDEKDKRIEDLTREVSRLDMFAHYFKNVEVKQIEDTTAEKVKPWWKFW